MVGTEDNVFFEKAGDYYDNELDTEDILWINYQSIYIERDNKYFYYTFILLFKKNPDKCGTLCNS